MLAIMEGEDSIIAGTGSTECVAFIAAPLSNAL